jgi:hypothetical protein
MAVKSLDEVVRLEKVTPKRGPGRPPKIPIEPTSEEVAQLMRNKAKHLRDNPLLQKMVDNPDSYDVLDLAMGELAKEAVSLDFERGEAERQGKDTTAISSKKITAVKAVIDTYLKKRDTVLNETFDFKSRKFKTLMEFWGSKFQRAAIKFGMSQEELQSYFQYVDAEFEGWEDEAMQYIKNNS